MSSRVERRTNTRYAFTVTVPCRVASSRTTAVEAAEVRDISAGGLGISVGSRLDPGVGLMVEFWSPDGRSHFRWGAVVRHATAGSDSRWILGCRLAGELTDDELLRALG